MNPAIVVVTLCLAVVLAAPAPCFIKPVSEITISSVVHDSRCPSVTKIFTHKINENDVEFEGVVCKEVVPSFCKEAHMVITITTAECKQKVTIPAGCVHDESIQAKPLSLDE